MSKTEDEQHLQLLSIFHYVVAAITALISCFPIFHFLMGILFIVASLVAVVREPDALSEMLMVFIVGVLFTVIAGSIILLGLALAFCIVLAGIFLHQHKRYLFCLALAGVQCAITPFGTVLGLFTIIVLVRPSVKALFVPVLPENP
jgi:hypothetical protein